jgi:myo-inositol 2-dehydrogenase/D-chiro-inositol 1-dehydrogenase
MLGAGFSAREHASFMREAAHADLCAVYDPVFERAARFGTDTGAAVVDSPDELIQRSDAIYVCIPTSEHHGAVRAVASSGKPLFCEKPLGRNLGEARAVADLVVSSGVVNQVGLVMRYSPAFYWIRHLLGQVERSGRVLAVSMRSDQYLPIHGAYESSWRREMEKAGAGVLLEHSIHDFDMIEQLVGPVRSLAANTRAVHGFAGIEDVAVVTFEAESGVAGSFVGVWHDMNERPENRRVEILCERLWCALDGYYHSGPVSWQWTGDQRARLAGSALRDAAMDAGMQTDNEDEAFATSVLSSQDATPTVLDALRAHRLVDAAYRSARRAGERMAIEGAVS